MIGSTLLHYEVTGKLGEGGMGEVYRATDSKLGREVAIKVLPAAFTEDEERLARFEREARLLAALEHPNIAGIYGLEEAEGQKFLVMQLAPGEDLATHLNRGPVALEVALPIAAQIAEALEAAHERGIVHRDLKPANIMVAPDHSVKVLDFGLAKAWDNGAGGSDVNLSMSPTLTAQMTQVGVILGTAGYMSPEQARGQEVDRRSDIWSFGVVLHEMLTGKRLFAADTVSDTLARVLMAEPEWETIDADFPEPISRLLHRCLERDLGRRLQAIGEARIAIEDFLADPGATSAPTHSESPTAVASRGSRPLLVAAGVVGGALAGWLLAAALSGPDEASSPVESFRFAIHAPMGALMVTEDVNGIDISRDGGMIAFVGRPPDSVQPSIYLKTAVDAEAQQLLGTDGARHPFFSPDGEWIAFFTDRELMKVSVRGGNALSLSPTLDRRGAVWGANRTIYFVPHSDGPIMQIPDSGGEARPLTTLDKSRRERTHRWPSLLPNGRGLLYTSDTFETSEFYDDARIEWIDLESGETKVILEGSSRAIWSPTGHLIFARDGSLYAISFDLESLEVSGTAQLALQDVSTVVSSGAVQYAISDDGSLAYVPGGKTSDIYDLAWISEGGETEIVVPKIGQYLQVALSPSGDRVILTASSQSTTHLWVYEMESGNISRLTFQGGNQSPVWTPDGKTVIFESEREATKSRLYSKPADGSESAELLWETEQNAFTVDISTDGETLITGVTSPDVNATGGVGEILWALDLTGKNEPYILFDEPVAGSYATISPDGRWIAYSSRLAGSSRIYVRPFPSGDGKWQVSHATSREPRWSPDGKRLYYRTTEGLKYVEVTAGDGFRAGRPVFFMPGNMGSPYNMTYSVSLDGDRVLMLPASEAESEWVIHVVLNWKAELEEKLRPAQ